MTPTSLRFAADLCAHVLYVCAVQLLKAQRSRFPDVVLPLCRDLVAVTQAAALANFHTPLQPGPLWFFCSLLAITPKP